MKIIFLSDVGGQGRAGEVKDIADGYALNFLIPRGLAKQATKESLASHEKLQAKIEAKKAEQEAKLSEAVKKLHGARIELKLRATEKGGLFKTVSAEDIAKALHSEKNVTVPPSAVRPLDPVKTTGDHIIKISLPGRQAGAAGAESELMLKIVGS